MIQNAPTFLDELHHPDQYGADLPALSRLRVPVRLTQGTDGPPLFARVIDRLMQVLPGGRRGTLEGAGHVPQLTMPKRYAETVGAFVSEAEEPAAERT